MGAAVQWVVITLAVIGAIVVAMGIWEGVSERIPRRDATDFEDDESGVGGVRGAAAGSRSGSTKVTSMHVRVHAVDRAPGPQLGAARLARVARTALDHVEAPTVIVRRYRPGRAPLVRDSVRGYRTGRLDRVLAGDFDLY